MTNFDRKLVNLIEDVTGGQVQELALLVDEYGTAPVARMVADGFGAVFSVPDSVGDYHAAVEQAILSCRFLRTEEALAVIQESPVSSEYKIHQAPGAFDLEDEPNLLFRYAADDPEAIDEVRRRHAERREPAEQQRRDFWRLRCR